MALFFLSFLLVGNASLIRLFFFQPVHHNLLFQDDKPIVECRVRYLSFLGIGKDVKQCAFIMHTAQDIFLCHVFHCEPSAGTLCKTIEAACKVHRNGRIRLIAKILNVCFIFANIDQNF